MTVVIEDPWLVVEGRCNVRKTDQSGLCRHEAGWGTDHVGFGSCRKHGGTSPSHRSHAAKQRETAILGPLLEAHREQIGDNPDPYAATLELVGHGWAWVRVLETRVAELGDDEGELYGPDHAGDLRPHVLVTMLRDARRDHLVVCKAAIDAGIAERAVTIAEDQASAFAAALRGVLAELGVWDLPGTPDVVRRHLRALPSGQAA